MARSTPPQVRRNALAPGLLAALVCLVSTFVIGDTWDTIARFALSILALICAWFAVQAQQWWWLLLYLPIAVVWNPIAPLPFSGPAWLIAHVAAAAGFIVGGLLLTERRE